MRKKALLFITCAAFVALTGCSSSQPAQTTAPTSADSNSASSSTDSTNSADNAGSTDGTQADSAAASESQAPEETTLALGKKTTLGDWDISVKKFSVKQKIQNGKYNYFKPSKGNSFVVLNMSVENKGTTDATFLPRFGTKDKTVVTTLYYKDEYEYSATQLMGYDKDLATKGIKPLTTKKGIVAFEVPKKVAKDKKNLSLKFTLNEESVTYALK